MSKDLSFQGRLYAMHGQLTESLRDPGADRDQIKYDLGYHAAMTDIVVWIEDDKDADDLLHEVECYLDSPDNWPYDEDESDLDAWHRRLALWEETECDNPDATIRAWTLMGRLSAAAALEEQGMTLPFMWRGDLISEVKDVLGVGVDE
jgi:hypothetical protein